VQYCPVWLPADQPGLPVFKNPNDHTVVGYLTSGGYSNWFQCELDMKTADPAGIPTKTYGYTSYWYAYTTADNLKKGWVSGIYYNGDKSYFVGLSNCGY
jgi:hypothetical protein